MVDSVMAMYGAETSAPSTSISTSPAAYGAASSSALKYWLEMSPRIRARPPASPWARTTTGGHPLPAWLSASTPRARRPSSSGWIGRLRMAGEPSTTKVP